MLFTATDNSKYILMLNIFCSKWHWNGWTCFCPFQDIPVFRNIQFIAEHWKDLEVGKWGPRILSFWDGISANFYWFAFSRYPIINIGWIPTDIWYFAFTDIRYFNRYDSDRYRYLQKGQYIGFSDISVIRYAIPAFVERIEKFVHKIGQSLMMSGHLTNHWPDS